MTTQPDYSGIPTMAYECIDFQDRQSLVECLKTMNVEVVRLKDVSLYWSQGFISWLPVKKYCLTKYNWVTRDQFLAPFKEVYDKWERETTVGRFTKHINSLTPEGVEDLKKHFRSDSLIVPSDEEIYKKMITIENSIDPWTEGAQWMRDEIIKRNKI